MSSAASHRPRDPAERWEIDCGEPGAGLSPRGIYDVFPRTPRRAEDLPGGALEALNRGCSLEGLDQLFVIPRGVRSTGHGDQRVISPLCVLGIGTRAVGLWTEEPDPGMKVQIPLDRIGAIEDVSILLYGRLTFFSVSERLTIRYNTLGRSSLRPALLSLRERLAGPPLPLPAVAPDPPDLPIKWKRLLRSTSARLREDAPVLCRFAVAARRTGEDIDRGQLLVVNPHEVVYTCDPPEASHNYAEDSWVVPRACITGVRIRAERLEVASNGAHVSLPMAPDLLEAAARWLTTGRGAAAGARTRSG